MTSVSSHVLDTTRGRPAAGVPIRLERQRDDGSGWELLGQGVTNADGRVTALCPPGALRTGAHRITFDMATYYRSQGIAAFYPEVQIQFVVTALEHHHIPLLSSPFGYSTYRGS